MGHFIKKGRKKEEKKTDEKNMIQIIATMRCEVLEVRLLTDHRR